MQSDSNGAGLRARRTTRSRTRIVAGTLAAATAVGLSLGAMAPAQAAPPPKGDDALSVDINLVTVNDFHGRIEQAGTAAGIARLSSAVDSFRAANPNTVFAAAGDLIGASTFTSFIQQDNPTIDALNAAGLDVSAVGNHEFDKGFADLTDRVMPRADWEYLGANVYRQGHDRPRAARVLDGEVPGRDHRVRRRRDRRTAVAREPGGHRGHHGRQPGRGRQPRRRPAQ